MAGRNSRFRLLLEAPHQRWRLLWQELERHYAGDDRAAAIELGRVIFAKCRLEKCRVVLEDMREGASVTIYETGQD